ncbi:hypothetical protein E2C01_011378 [Portunus trituberculatus]|uniref:Uncharacterized protein n=1 Tax=Portunus trituberculatus TaxID=210409 RepID=A0A5B7DB80_PORTR|nr:hypothetical protein [Portunus trituberculatus]
MAGQGISSSHINLGASVVVLRKASISEAQVNTSWTHCLTRWDTGGATHSRGGTLDHIVTCGLVVTRVQCSSVPALFSDHVALEFHYTLPDTRPTLPVTRPRIALPPKYCPTYISYMSQMLPTFDLSSADQLYLDLVSATKDFYRLYVSRPHLQRRHTTRSWILDEHIQRAKEKAELDGLVFQANPTLEMLHRYQTSRDAFVALQECAGTKAWQRFTTSRQV